MGNYKIKVTEHVIPMGKGETAKDMRYTPIYTDDCGDSYALEGRPTLGGAEGLIDIHHKNMILAQQATYIDYTPKA